MLQSGFPSEEEQVAQYQGMLQMFNDKPVTLRTLDVGADKQLPYMPISEENPCLGWRGIRITLDQPEIFLIQVRAMLRANAATGNLNILLPMVTSLDEVDEARRLIERAGREVEEMIGYEFPNHVSASCWKCRQWYLCCRIWQSGSISSLLAPTI
ncbi:phosphoenolpyruvate-protein phosphotransferase (PTS system, enzyme I) [Escherichia coli]|uniref:Phosphoenolpyruvate-protein phosphotransferase (PTS system, enzyme I) n=1 Tax=Escherichia coli TaxID=562 RepID=A0A377CV96_ECOLX|nr:phosphoenolpyruvate-protein phosphotransferase (PTS system, enzyme I) [Escherichia coli]